MPVRGSLSLFVEDRNRLELALEKTREQYRQYNPGWYLYRRVIAYTDIVDRFSDDFIELVYATLGAWNMNSRGARLAEFDVFKRSLLTQRNRIIELAHHRLEPLSLQEANQLLQEFIRPLFFDLILVAEDKPRLVTYSKTLHFFLPLLVMPVDRRYTLMFFYLHDNIPRSIERQYIKFSEIFIEFQKFAAVVQLQPFLDNTWNANIPKTIDNLIIGHFL